jgi:hypothetical protein
MAAVIAPADRADTDSPIEYCGDRNAMMPRPCRTRRQDRADRVAANEDGTTLPARPVKPARSAISGRPHATPSTSHDRFDYGGRRRCCGSRLG